LAVSENDASDPSDVELSDFIANELGTKALRFTDGVRMVLRQSASREVPISVPEIRDQLINLGFNFAKYAQPLVPIHNTLKRLEEQGEVSPIKNEQGQTLGYKWISPIERALASEGSTRTANAYADIFRSPAMQEKVRAAIGNPTSVNAARERFKQAHDARYPRGRTVKPPPGIDD
jgi:hypothetical protein